MKKYKEKKCKKQVLKTIECDHCGEKIDKADIRHDNYLDFKYRFGYGHAQDGNTLEFQLCMKCFMNLLHHSGIDFRIHDPYLKEE